MPRSSQRTVKKPRRRPAAHLLVMECHTKRLHKEGLAFGTALHQRFSQAHQDKVITLAATDTRQELRERLGEIRMSHDRYRSVVIVAHSNTQGLLLTSEDFCDWTVLAAWLRELSPEHLFLVACDAGQLSGICTLFAGLPSLRKVYASPVPINPEQAQHLELLIQELLRERRVDETTLRITQALSFVASRGVLFRWTRSDCQQHNEFRGIAQTLGAQFLK